jgi:hypothetical protein
MRDLELEVARENPTADREQASTSKSVAKSTSGKSSAPSQAPPKTRGTQPVRKPGVQLTAEEEFELLRKEGADPVQVEETIVTREVVHLKCESGKSLTYEEMFDYFARLFYNFLFYIDDTETCEKILEKMQEVGKYVFEGETSKKRKVERMTPPKDVPPFAHWTSLKRKPLDVTSALQGMERSICSSDRTADMEMLRALKNGVIPGPEGLALVDQAIREVQNSHILPNPSFTVEKSCVLVKSGQNPLSAFEVEVELLYVDRGTKGVRNVAIELPDKEAHFQFDVPAGQGPFEPMQQSVTMKRVAQLANWPNKRGKISIDRREPVVFPLKELHQRATANFHMCVGESVVKFAVMLQKRIGTGNVSVPPEKMLVKYHVSPYDL